jgi:uncharacterized membrane protein (UPF0127 family)
MRVAGIVTSGLLLVLSACPAPADTCNPGRADLRWTGGQASFNVEIADTDAERSRGLMYRRTLAPDAGMLFVYDGPRPVAFWMRNTLIPLDMLFFGQDGRVRMVHPEAVPGDETPIQGGDDIQFVLELPGGTAARLGVTAGTELHHPSVPDRFAAWPCD